MAGSIGHVIKDGIYHGWSHLDNRSDDIEAIEEFAFVLLATTTADQRAAALKQFYDLCASRTKFPDWWKPNTSEQYDGDHLPPQRRRNP